MRYSTLTTVVATQSRHTVSKGTVMGMMRMVMITSHTATVRPMNKVIVRQNKAMGQERISFNEQLGDMLTAKQS